MSFFFFFFKQRTAYEMRISDWSSDVCSSDLAAEGLDRGIAHRIEGEEGIGARQGRDVAVRPVHEVAVEHDDGAHLAGGGHDATLGGKAGQRLVIGHAAVLALQRDRKSVVWGESVSDRVDIGGGG